MYDYVKENNVSKKEQKEFKKYLQEVHKIYEAEDRFEVLDIINNYDWKHDEFSEVINNILDKKIVPFSSYLTMFLEDDYFALTSNWIEHIFENIAHKHLINSKTLLGFLSWVALKIEKWDQ